ncbi:IclR family transcriptional regulator [Paenibacillus beijingensis]|uniref:IclR family transcriptional regulator n=1 Tax=Paenibacillus beijingensis TaxID=1126833 RepID=A0A0D5NEY0_9BACL|nr:IclR family transcriptional regulator [Paenibacillus beijingensis]AJY73478.1 IclR family transcriptional regulator [Paenibacillus beijingensis]
MSVISKAINILDILVPQGNEKEVSVTEISRELEMPVQSVHRILVSLSQHGFVSQNNKTRKYKLGLCMMKYGFLMQDSLMLRSTARPFMEELSKQTKETVYLAMRENMEGVYIDSIDSSQALKISEPIGLRLPLFIGASNRVILAYLPQKTRERILADVDWSSVSSLKPLTREFIDKELEQIREQGYAVTSGEATEGTTGIGAPIFSYENTVIGSLNCAGPTQRFTSENIEKISFYLKKYAHLISKELGYRKLYRL